MNLQVFLLFVSNILLAYSQCAQLSDPSTCVDAFYNKLIDSKICVDECPYQYTQSCDLNHINSCECTIPTSAGLFELDFSKIQDLSQNCIVSLINPSDSWTNPSGVPYNSADKTSPYPTRSRGFYFSPTSSITSSQNFIPALYFTANAWIQPISAGYILRANLNSKNYIELLYDSQIFIFRALVTYWNRGVETQIDISSNIIENNWQFLSVQINQVYCDEVDLIISRNNFEILLTSWNNAEAGFEGGNYIWTIGESNINSFTGFLYWIEAKNSLDVNYWYLDFVDFCSVLNYFGQCISCNFVLGCQDVACTPGKDDCSNCYSKDCAECYGYEETMCTKCTTGVLPNCCDWLATTCTSTTNSTNCVNNIFLIDGVCLYGVPYGFVNDLPLNTPVINADFTKSFTGIYDNIFVTGISQTSYNFWNSPEIIDPVPAKQRGLYFIPKSYLKATINLYHTFSIATWIYTIRGYYITYLGSLLKVHINGGLKITMQSFVGHEITYSSSISPTLNNWNYVSYSIEYHGDETSTITPYINAVPGTPFSVPEGLFRPTDGGEFYLGSSNFNGFISLFVLWQWAITDFTHYMSYFDGATGLNLWSCNFDYFYDGWNYVKCLSTCQSGCARGDSCNICDSEFCLQCSSFEPNSCILCEGNRSGPFCDCNSGYYQLMGQASCSQCYTGCSHCTGSLYYQCLSCISGYYYFSPIGVCLSECPLGYSNTTNECALDFELIFDLNLNTSSGVIYDKASSIPVITGSSEKFYPDYEDDDPIIASFRGFYFNGNSSIMRLPEYNSYISPKLKIGPVFTISIWLNIEQENSAIISKNDISNDYSTIYAITLINLKPVLSLLIDNSIIIYSSGIQINSYEWSHLAFFVTIDKNNGNSSILCYVNSNPDFQLNAGFGYFEDISDNAITLIGAQQLSQIIGNFFQGFIYEIKIYNTAYDIGLLSQTSCSEDCQVCNITGLCIPNCNITENWEGPGYNNCLENCDCNNTCQENPEFCTVCNVTLCNACLDDSTDKCKTCKINASLLDDSCVCDNGYNGTTECTYVPFFANLLVFTNNSLSLSFSDPLQSTLTFADLMILLETGQEISWSLEKMNSTYYSIPTQINEKIEKNTIINVTFLDLLRIKSIYNGILNSSTIIATLYEYDPNTYSVLVSKMASKVTTTVTSSVVASVAVSFINPNPSSLWGLLNCLQILSYLSLSGIPFSENMINFLSNLNSYSILPNFFEFFIDENDGNKAYKEAENFGYNTDLILLNQGDDFVIIGASIILVPFIMYFAQCSYRIVGKKFENMLKNYKYGFYLRFWIQCYLELGAAACVGLKMFKIDNWVQITNIIICFGLILLFAITPVAFLWFSYRNRLKIQSKDKNFISLFDSFFYEFHKEKGLIYSLYYFVYFVRRFIYVLNLVFLSENPKAQVSINMICSLLSIFYLAIYGPFEDKIIQISNLISEIMIGVIIFITSFYLFDVSSNVITYVENSIIVISMTVIGTQFCTSVAIFVRTVYQILKYKLKLYGNAKLSIHQMEEGMKTDDRMATSI